jgi:NAD-dependent DNA ligase
MEEKFNFVFPDSPTQKVGYSEDNSTFKKVYRKTPMLSLDSVNNYLDLVKFDERIKKNLKTREKIEYICE